MSEVEDEGKLSPLTVEEPLPRQFGKYIPLTPDEPLPRQFGKYTLLRKLAVGGMAELFLALHRSVAGFEKLIVIKRILPAMNQDKGFIEMLLHEARIAATLSHPNIVHIFDLGQVDGVYFIAMEHIHGEDIRAIVRAMKKKDVFEFPLEHAMAILLGVSAGLAYAHEKRDLDGATLDIVHRDISPQNIVVTFTGDVKVVDFGIAKSGTQVGEDTESGQLKGKVPYMSPEQASGEKVDWRSDIFAAGVVLFELTTGRRLFKGASEYETLKLICEKEYPRPSDVRPDYSPMLERIVMKALAKKRDERYQSAREMQSDLEDFVREERVPVSTLSLSKWMHSLFADQLEAHKEALQGVKPLADRLAAEQMTAGSMYEVTTGTGGSMRSAQGSVASIAPAPRSARGMITVAAVAALLGAGGFVYMRHTAAVAAAAAELDARAREIAAQQRPEDGKGSLEITSTPDGCAIWIDGDLRPETTPSKIEGLPYNRALDVKLTKDGLEAYRESVTLTTASPSKSIVADMKAGSVTLVIKVEPAPSIWLDGRSWKGDGNKIERISAGEEHKLVLAAPGYAAKTITFVAQRGETKIISERLLRVDPNLPPPVTDDVAAATSGGSDTLRVGAKGAF